MKRLDKDFWILDISRDIVNNGSTWKKRPILSEEEVYEEYVYEEYVYDNVRVDNDFSILDISRDIEI